MSKQKDFEDVVNQQIIELGIKIEAHDPGEGDEANDQLGKAASVLGHSCELMKEVFSGTLTIVKLHAAIIKSGIQSESAEDLVERAEHIHDAGVELAGKMTAQAAYHYSESVGASEKKVDTE